MFGLVIGHAEKPGSQTHRTETLECVGNQVNRVLYLCAFVLAPLSSSRTTCNLNAGVKVRGLSMQFPFLGLLVG